MKYFYHIIFSAVIILVANSCKTKKPVIEINDNVTQSNQSSMEIAGEIPMFEWFDGKFDADINTDGKLNSIKGRVRIRKDSLIWIQIKPDVAIIEAFRILISPDSVKLVDYINKKYFMDEFNSIKDFIKYDVSFSLIQNIFSGNPTYIFELNAFTSYKNKLGDDIIASSDFNQYVSSRNSRQPANYLFQALWFNNRQHKRNIMYDPSNRVELDLQYQEFEMLDSVRFPKTTQLTIIGDSTKTRFSYTYTKTDTKSVFEFPFTIPDNYERIWLNK